MKALATTTLALLLACSSVVQVASRSTGAPAEACSTFTQQHPPFSTQTSPIPYTIDLSVFDDGNGNSVYQPGNTYQLQRFFIGGVVAADGTSPTGTFSNPPPQSRLSSCTPSNIAITHQYSGPGAAVDRDSVTVTLTAPSAGTGPIRFRYAVTQVYSTFWADDRTDVIAEATSIPDQGGMGGDPHYSILLPTGQLLCFSVQGEKGFSFNLISNENMHMNALFIQDPQREEITWIGALGIVVKNTTYGGASGITKLRFDASDNKVYINNKVVLHPQKVDKLTFGHGKLTISEAVRPSVEKHAKVAVDFLEVGLAFTVRFTKNHLDLIWNKVKEQPSNSHGMIGQFFRNGVEIDEARKLLMLPTMDPVPVMRKPVWHFMEREVADDQLCWVAMNPGYQGRRLIEGHYLDYLVNDVLSNNFNFRKTKH